MLTLLIMFIYTVAYAVLPDRNITDAALLSQISVLFATAVFDITKAIRNASSR